MYVSLYECLYVCTRVHPYLVGSTGWVESICTTHKQGVIVLLQEDFDEVVTLVLQGEEEKERYGDICRVFLITHRAMSKTGHFFFAVF